MTSFDERDKAFENKFAHDEEITFKINARAARLAGLWAAAKLGKTATEAESYANALVTTKPAQLAEQLLADFSAAKLPVKAADIHAEITRQAAVAKAQILGATTT